ncbi:hypothetical protein [Rhizocola hellebori]|uniref:hypothetical protein n=1 Tax=Rhizocola hellebori TaxID=1392758 RepID=UPI0019432761|nr:hypothetical protein [Rhizocola hellebori]
MRRLPVLLAAVLLAAACESGPKVIADPPTGARDLVLRMVELPGMLPPGGGLTTPVVSVYGGGIAVVKTAGGLVQRQLTEAGVKKVSQAAADAGLAGKAAPGAPAGPDAPSVTFVVVSGGKRHVNLVVSPEGKIAALRDRLKDLDGFLGPDIGPEKSPYKPSRLAVWAQPQETSASPRKWELNDLATAGEGYEVGRCQVLTADAAEPFAGAKTGEFWRSGDATYYVIFRPMLPDEEKCPRVESLAVS